MIPPIPRYLLPHTVTLINKLESDGWGGSASEQRTTINFVYMEPCISKKFSLSGDIPEARAKLIFDAYSSVPGDVSFNRGDKVIFGSEEYVISEVQTFYGDTSKVHHLEVLLK